MPAAPEERERDLPGERERGEPVSVGSIEPKWGIQTAEPVSAGSIEPKWGIRQRAGGYVIQKQFRVPTAVSNCFRRRQALPLLAACRPYADCAPRARTLPARCGTRAADASFFESFECCSDASGSSGEERGHRSTRFRAERARAPAGNKPASRHIAPRVTCFAASLRCRTETRYSLSTSAFRSCAAVVATHAST